MKKAPGLALIIGAGGHKDPPAESESTDELPAAYKAAYDEYVKSPSAESLKEVILACMDEAKSGY